MEGWAKGAKPNPNFDPAWCLARYPDVAATGINPLLHYITFGEAEGRDPPPVSMPMVRISVDVRPRV